MGINSITRYMHIFYLVIEKLLGYLFKNSTKTIFKQITKENSKSVLIIKTDN